MTGVLGIDAAAALTGYSAGTDHTTGTIAPPTIKMPGDRPGWLKCTLTVVELRKVVERTRPWLVLIEGGSAPMSGRGGAWRDRLHGAIGCMLTSQVVRFLPVHPTTLKAYAVRGGADKAEMMAAAIVAGAPEVCGRVDDAADAWWLWRLGVAALDLDGDLRPVVGNGARTAPRKLRKVIEATWGLP